LIGKCGRTAPEAAFWRYLIGTVCCHRHQ